MIRVSSGKENEQQNAKKRILLFFVENFMIIHESYCRYAEVRSNYSKFVLIRQFWSLFHCSRNLKLIFGGLTAFMRNLTSKISSLSRYQPIRVKSDAGWRR